MGLFTIAMLAVTACGGPEYPKCDKDEQCQSGEFCVNGMCQQCRGDEDCGAGQACNAGRCEAIEGYCSGSGDCPAGEDCVSNRCQPAQSTEDLSASASNKDCQLAAVHFDFDSSELDPGARNTLEKNARCIQKKGIDRVQVTGHTDPRGTEEYNLALGDRRARTAKDFVVRMGVEDDKVSTTSMGEEMSKGADESSWKRDRRADFSDK